MYILPKGWQLVPNQLTEAMAAATFSSNALVRNAETTVSIYQAYKNQLAAAPAAPALESVRGEPVAWARFSIGDPDRNPRLLPHALVEESRKASGAWTPLYTHPAPDMSAELSDAQIDRILSTRIPGGSSARDWFLPHELPKGLANVRDVVRAMLKTATESAKALQGLAGEGQRLGLYKVTPCLNCGADRSKEPCRRQDGICKNVAVAQSEVMINGLTESETSATASVAGTYPDASKYTRVVLERGKIVEEGGEV